jgi:PPOX class probable F420-dependent enzyme
MRLIPDEYQDLLKDETKSFAFLATLMKDGSPQLTPVWFNTDDNYVLINSAMGRVKDRNMRRDARIALVILDPKNPYRYLQIRGKIVEITTKGAHEHIDILAKKYTGADHYTNFSPGEVRVTYKIQPENLSKKKK